MNQILRDAAVQLIEMYCKPSNTIFTFPDYQNQSQSQSQSQSHKTRVSEQESKVILAHLLINNQIRFSVEVPTISKHSFSGQKELSARFDIATYSKENQSAFDFIIELKAHNPELKSFEKDFEKMIASDSDCIWFHTLENEDKGTIDSLLKKMKLALDNKIIDNEGQHKWIIVFVVLKRRRIYMNTIDLDGKSYGSIDDKSKYQLETLP